MATNISIRDMDFDEALASSRKLGQMIEQIDFQPDYVVGVATGGILPARTISDSLRCPLVLIRVSRPMTSVKKRLGLIYLPSLIKKGLRRLEMTLGVYRFLNKRSVKNLYGAPRPGRVLLVDDSLDTGNTMRAALDFLRTHTNTDDVKPLIAVITQIFDDATPAADIYLHKNVNFCFPWSQDSVEYKKFHSFCDDKFESVPRFSATVLD